MKRYIFSSILKVLTFIMFIGMGLTLIACGSASATTTTTTVATTTTEPVVLSATLTDLTVNGTTVMGFSPSINDYVLVLSSGVTVTPTVAAVKYSSDSSVVIDNAVNVESNVISDRTTTISVTTSDGLTTNVYTVLFESTIAPVTLGTAGNFVILAESGISTSTSSIVTGDIGLSPSAATYITGFSLTMDSTNTFSTSSQIVGSAFASDYTSPTGNILTTAISDMQTAYIDAAGRTANYTELYAGDLSGKTLTSGVYNWGNSVLINTDLTLSGSATDVWIFQIAGTLTQASGISITLIGGALAENIFWQVADTVAIGTGAHFEGTILAMTNISCSTNASVYGNLYSQTAVTLDACTITKK
ncbi:MAG: ice-binding family protein [Candidatus Izemoplasmatales bacterium]|nr:ice-binding family protein [Candidatus Izemoplasmatales bacterium]